MKIVHLSPQFFPHLGGVETHVYQVSQQLRAAGHQVTILTLSDSTVPDHEDVDGLSVVRHQAGLPVRSGWWYKVSLWRWLWHERRSWLDADVVQVHDVFWWVLPFLPWVSHKVFTTFHGWETHYPVRFSAKLQRAVWSWLSVATIHIGAWIQEFYWDRPTAVLYGAANQISVKHHTARPLQMKKVVFIGRLSAENEVAKYIELFTKLQLSFPNLSLQWVGDGPLRTECEKYGEVTGMVKNPGQYVASADLVAVSSYLAMWMGLAAGKLCLSFYSNPLKKRYLESFPGAKEIIISQNPSDMVEEIKTLMKNPKKIKKLLQEEQDLTHQHTWAKVSDTYLQLWSSV